MDNKEMWDTNQLVNIIKKFGLLFQANKDYIKSLYFVYSKV